MDFEGKHVFFISDRDRFFCLFGDALIAKLGLRAENVVAIVFKTDRQPMRSTRLAGASYLDYEGVEIDTLSEAKSVTFMSLNRWNSPIARRLIEADEKYLEKIHIFITDDEVDRWKQNYSANGKLIENLGLNISDNCIYVIERVMYFIAPKAYFHDKIREVSNRKDIIFLDASIIFDVLPHTYSEMMRTIFCENLEFGAGGARVLVETKGFSWKKLFRFLNNPVLQKRSSNMQFFCFINPRRRLLVEIFRAYSKFLGRASFNITYLAPMPPQMYNAMLASCTHLILQDRGGASTARLFAKWGRGRIAVRRNSPNHIFLEECYGIDLYLYDQEEAIDESFFDDFDSVASARKVCAEEQRSLSVLSSVYS